MRLDVRLMRAHVRSCVQSYLGDYRIRDFFLYKFNRHSKGERTNGVYFKKGERTIGSDHMKTLCIMHLYISIYYYITTITITIYIPYITINENNNTDVLFMLLAQIKWLTGLQ